MSTNGPRISPQLALARALLAARAARLHHIDGKTHVEIAEEIGVNRIRVAQLIESARETGVLRFEILPPFGLDTERSATLRKKFGLSEALVSPATQDQAAVGLLVARYLGEVLSNGGRLGMAWGNSISALVQGIENLPAFPRVDVVQLIGGVPTLDGSLHASSLLGRVGAVTGGRVFALQSAMILPSAATARGLRAEQSIARTFDALRTIDVAVAGIGDWASGESRVLSELPPPEEFSARADGIAADFCGVFVNSMGEILAPSISDRMISATAEDFAAMPLRVGVATGEKKVAGVRALLRSSLVNVLATDAATADLLLAS